MRFSTLAALAVVPAATMAYPGQYLGGSAFEPFPMMELKRSANEGVYEKRSDGFTPLPTGTPTVPSYPTLSVAPEDGLFDKRFEDEADAIPYESGHGKRDASYPTAYKKRSEPSGHVKRAHPTGFVDKRETLTGVVTKLKRAHPTGFIDKRETLTSVATKLKHAHPTGYVKKEASTEHEEQHAHMNREELIKRYYPNPTGYLNKRRYGSYAPAPTGGSFPGLKLGQGEGMVEKRAEGTGYVKRAVPTGY